MRRKGTPFPTSNFWVKEFPHLKFCTLTTVHKLSRGLRLCQDKIPTVNQYQIMVLDNGYDMIYDII